MTRPTIKKIISFLFLCSIFSNLFAQDDNSAPDETPFQYAELIQTDDELFRIVHFLCLQTTSVCLADKEPATRAEVALYLQKLDTEKLSAKGCATEINF